jgi:hypothetical protein
MKRVRLALLFALVGFVLLLYGFQGVTHVQHHNGANIESKSWVWLDALDFPDLQTLDGHFEGWLRVPDSGVLWLENNTGADVKMMIDSSITYEGNEATVIALNAQRGQVVSFRLEYTLLSDFPPDGRIGLLEEGLAGFRYVVAPWSFAPPEIGSNVVGLIARPVSLIFLICAFVIGIVSLRLARRDWLW